MLREGAGQRPGVLTKVGMDTFVDPELEALQRQIAEKLGYRLVDHRMELYGVRLSRED
jgi:acyl CoA:acetate/3-ketoacid CoA transferase